MLNAVFFSNIKDSAFFSDYVEKCINSIFCISKYCYYFR